VRPAIGQPFIVKKTGKSSKNKNSFIESSRALETDPEAPTRGFAKGNLANCVEHPRLRKSHEYGVMARN